MPQSSKSETFRICLEMEIVGTRQEVQTALASNVRERCDPPVGSGEILVEETSSGPEDALIWIVAGLQLENQIRRVLGPLDVYPVKGGLRLSRPNGPGT